MLLVGERRGRITKERPAAFLEDVELLPIDIVREPKSGDVMDLARRYQLICYDAAYLELAKPHAAPRATFDQALVTAAKKLKTRLAL